MAQRIVALEQQLAQSKLQSVKKPAIPNPKQFTGEAIGGYTIDDWIDDVEKQIRHHNTYFTTDAVVVEFASSYLSGKANGWWKSTQEERRTGGLPTTNTWSDMKREMLERFRPIEAATLARMALDKMQQKGSVPSYTEYFYKQMMYIKDMSVPDQLHCYTRGLKPFIRGEVMKAKPATIHEAVNIASTAESLQSMSQPQLKYSTGTSRFGSSSSNHSGGVPMELSNINQQGNPDDGSSNVSSSSSGASMSREQLLNVIIELQKNQVQHSINAMFNPNSNSNSTSNSNKKHRVPGVTKSEYERCRAEGLCINCKQPNHISKDCKNAYLKF
jgi:hypothetical protein